MIRLQSETKKISLTTFRRKLFETTLLNLKTKMLHIYTVSQIA